MGTKAKGSRAERELFHRLWDEQWAVVRSAGSGCTTKPAPDLIASNGSRVLAIECKSVKGESKYFEKEEIEQLTEFSRMFGAEAWIAVRFDTKGWFFVKAEDVPATKGKSFSVTYDHALKNGKKLEEFLGKFSQQRIIS